MVIRTCCRCRFSRDRVAHSCGGNGVMVPTPFSGPVPVMISF